MTAQRFRRWGDGRTAADAWADVRSNASAWLDLGDKDEWVEVHAPDGLDPLSWATMVFDAADDQHMLDLLTIMSGPACRARLLVELAADPDGPAMVVRHGISWLVFGTATVVPDGPETDHDGMCEAEWLAQRAEGGV